MKKIYGFLINGIFPLLYIFCSEVTLSAQNGAWIAQSPEGIGTGGNVYSCGDGSIIFTKSSARYLLLFDINEGEWQKADMKEVRTWKHVQAQGDVVLGISNDLLFGYSSITGEWDTISYKGTILKEESQQSQYRSYGCSDSLAFCVTDEVFYLFDGNKAKWYSLEYQLPPGFTAGTFSVKNDFACAILPGAADQDEIVNMAYSAYTNSFAIIRNGGSQGYLPRYVHGFIGFKQMSVSGGSDVRLAGYSAYDNEFDVITVSVENTQDIDWDNLTDAYPDEGAVFSLYVRTVVPSVSVSADWYSYSTFLGEWHTASASFNILDNERYDGSIMQGGLYSVDFFYNGTEWNCFFYSGLTGNYETVTPVAVSGTAGTSVFAASGDGKVWGYNPLNKNGSVLNLTQGNIAYLTAANDYSTFREWSTGSDSMLIWFYNGRTNRWHSFKTPEHVDRAGTFGENLHLYKSNPENHTVVYSSLLDTLLAVDLNDNITYIPDIEGNLVALASANHSVLINAGKGKVHEMNFNFNPQGLGTGSAVFTQPAAGMLYGYSGESDTWTTLAATGEPYLCTNKGSLGLVTIRSGSKIYYKYCAFNALTDSWIELIPEGTHVAYALGYRTALIIMSGTLYAFDPYGTASGISSHRLTSVDEFTLEQNYPNPFSCNTTLRYILQKPANVSLGIYDLAGREIRVLVNQYQSPGEYSVIWDGKSAGGDPAADGLYIYRLLTGNSFLVRRMVRSGSRNR